MALAVIAPAEAVALEPAFDPSIRDYTVTCDQPVRVRARTVRLEPGEAMRFRVGGRRYHARCVPADFPQWTTERTGEPAAKLIALAPSLGRERTAYSVIVDGHGVPIWWMRAPRESPFDFEVLPGGTVAWFPWTFGRTYSQGAYVRQRLDGTPLGTIGAGVNHHDLQPLPNGNLLVTAYPAREHVDLTAIGGPADATVLDAEVRELTPRGRVAWSWNAKDHLTLDGLTFPLDAIRVPYRDGTAYDLDHVNSVAPAPNGDVIVSLRHRGAVYRIRRDGRVRWKLGGFGGQHDARLLADGTVTLYDNGTGLGRPPRALRYRIERTKARLLEEITDPDVGASPYCGSARRLANGHWLIAWAPAPLVTETDARGRRVLALHFATASTYRAVPVTSVTRTQLRRAMDAQVR